MEDYRVYFLDDLGEHIISARQFKAPDEDSAVHMAERMRGLSPLELWHDATRIVRWDAISPGP